MRTWSLRDERVGDPTEKKQRLLEGRRRGRVEGLMLVLEREEGRESFRRRSYREGSRRRLDWEDGPPSVLGREEEEEGSDRLGKVDEERLIVDESRFCLWSVSSKSQSSKKKTRSVILSVRVSSSTDSNPN